MYYVRSLSGGVIKLLSYLLNNQKNFLFMAERNLAYSNSLKHSPQLRVRGGARGRQVTTNEIDYYMREYIRRNKKESG
jgi:hypothetical protein